MAELPQNPKKGDDEPLSIPSWSLLGQARYTKTGELWLIAPWLLILRKKLRCTLLEWMIFVAALGSSEGTIIRALAAHYPVRFLIAIGLLLIQGFLWCFAAALYNQKLYPDKAARYPQGAYVFVHLIVPAMGCNVLGYMISSSR